MAKRPPPEGYRERLAEYIAQQLEATGMDIRSLGEAMGVSHASISRWENMQISGRISCESLKGLAAYRNETPDETAAWLEGKPIEERPPSLQEQINALTKRMEALESAIETETEASQDETTDDPAKMIAKWFDRFSLTEREYHLEALQMTVEELQDVLAGERSVPEEQTVLLAMAFGEQIYDFVVFSKEGTARLEIQRSLNLTVDED